MPPAILGLPAISSVIFKGTSALFPPSMAIEGAKILKSPLSASTNKEL